MRSATYSLLSVGPRNANEPGYESANAFASRNAPVFLEERSPISLSGLARK
jgi:hypothetical protein